MPRWKRIILALLVLVVIGLIAFDGRRRLEVNAKKNREATYQTKSRSFSGAVEPGMTRNQVQHCFHSDSLEYFEGCCVVFETSVNRRSFDALVTVGQTDHPWYCRENNVYIADQFHDYEKQQRLGHANGHHHLSPT